MILALACSHQLSLADQLVKCDGPPKSMSGLTRRWKAMLLLDEADVFLGKRFSSGGDSIERNELVSSKDPFEALSDMALLRGL